MVLAIIHLQYVEYIERRKNVHINVWGKIFAAILKHIIGPKKGDYIKLFSWDIEKIWNIEKIRNIEKIQNIEKIPDL